MKKNKKIKMIFDGIILTFGMKKNSSRSGVFFTAKSIFNEFIKDKDFNISLYIESNNFDILQKALKCYYPDKNFKIITDIDDNLYEKLKRYKDRKKVKKQYFRKFLVQLLTYIVSPFSKLSIKIKSIFRKNYDIYFSPCFEIPNEFKCNKKMKKYTIIHDVISIILPRYKDIAHSPDAWFLELLRSFNQDDYYFSNSEHTKQDFIKYCPQINPSHITTTLLACDEKFRPVSAEQTQHAKEKYNIPLDKKYVFSLCTLEPRKNLIRTVKTFIEFIKKNNIDDLVFVLGGGHWDIFIKQLEDEIENLNEYKDKIIRAGYIDDEDLAPLYSGAEWFVYTSQYEGFGLPPLEAMSCGCPVITSNNSSLPEVVGDAGIMIDWDSDQQHIEAYEKYYFNENLRKEYAAKGLERAKLFSWKKCADKMIEIMKSNA